MPRSAPKNACHSEDTEGAQQSHVVRAHHILQNIRDDQDKLKKSPRAFLLRQGLTAQHGEAQEELEDEGCCKESVDPENPQGFM